MRELLIFGYMISMCPCRYLLLNCNLSDIYAFTMGELCTNTYGLGYTDLPFKEGKLRNWKSTRSDSTRKILSNTLHVRTLIAEIFSLSRPIGTILPL